MQSVATAASDIASAADVTANPDDSVLTTTSIMSKKSTRGKKATAAKGRKTRTKKDDVVEIHEDEPEDVEMAPPPPKPARGRKRTSAEIEDPVAANAEAPATKKRVVGAKGGIAADTSIVTTATSQDVEMTEAAPSRPAAGKKNAKTRKASQASIRSQASTASLRAQMSEEAEIERQLQAELDAPLTDDENLAVDSDSERKKTTARGRPKKGTTTRKASAQKPKPQLDGYAMFDPTPVEQDDADVDAELKALEAEVEAESAQPMETLDIPKKGRKTGTRKASKQTKKAKEPIPPSDPIDDPVPEAATAPAPEPARELPGEVLIESKHGEDPDSSTATVINRPAAPRESIEKRGRGRPPKNSTSSQPRGSLETAKVPQVAPQAPAVVPAKIVVEIEPATARESLSNRRPSDKIASNRAQPPTVAPAPEPMRSGKALPFRAWIRGVRGTRRAIPAATGNASSACCTVGIGKAGNSLSVSVSAVLRC